LGSIIVLPNEVASKIAAGEVIEGPGSVVRELLDNSIDAQALHIKVLINNGGKEYILVSDDGYGMSREDAVLSIQKHSTSKLKNIDDLISISTLGFRGEALSSITAVSDFSMLTKRDGEAFGTRLTCRYGKDFKVKPAGANVGTEVTVRGLFHNLPARKKFLRSNRAESSKVKEEVLKKALSFPGTGFYYKSDERLVFNLFPVRDFRPRIKQIFGEELERNLINISHREDMFAINGFISNRNYLLSNRGGQYLFVNRRAVEDKSLFFALNQPAKSTVPAGKYVYAFLFMEIDPFLVDINVHPAKKEIRIKIERKLFETLYTLVENALREKFYVPGNWKGSYPITGISKPNGWSSGVKESGDGVPVLKYQKKQLEKVIQTGKVEHSGEKVDFLHQKLKSGELFNEVSDSSFLEWWERFEYRGLLLGIFLLFEGQNLLVIIDQHAAHERVLYEKYKQLFSGETEVKNLLLPINFTPPRSFYQHVLDSIEVLGLIGINIEPFGEESFNVNTLPAFIPDHKEEEILSDLLQEIYEGKFPLKSDSIRERFAAISACRNAIKDGDMMGEEEARALVRELKNTEIPHICPHGRPTFMIITREDLEKVFKRR